METVGFIGLGNMGSGMAGNLQKAGYPLVVYDVQEEATRGAVERGARLAHSPAEVARLSNVVMTSLPGPREVEDVALGPRGLIEGIREGGVYVDLSTSSPGLTRRLEAMFRDKGAAMLDAPVSGGKRGAATRNLSVMVGGDRGVFERIESLLDAIGDKVYYVGGVGAGNICKIVHNVMGFVVMQALAEGLTLGVKAGVEPRALWECVRRGGLGRMSGLHEVIPRTIFPGDFESPGFTLALSRKDTGLATAMGREFNVPMPLANLVEQIAIEALNRGWGEKDSSITFRLQEEAAGVQVRASGVDPAIAARFISTHPEIE